MKNSYHKESCQSHGDLQTYSLPKPSRSNQMRNKLTNGTMTQTQQDDTSQSTVPNYSANRIKFMQQRDFQSETSSSMSYVEAMKLQKVRAQDEQQPYMPNACEAGSFGHNTKSNSLSEAMMFNFNSMNNSKQVNTYQNHNQENNHNFLNQNSISNMTLGNQAFTSQGSQIPNKVIFNTQDNGMTDGSFNINSFQIQEGQSLFNMQNMPISDQGSQIYETYSHKTIQNKAKRAQRRDQTFNHQNQAENTKNQKQMLLDFHRSNEKSGFGMKSKSLQINDFKFKQLQRKNSLKRKQTVKRNSSRLKQESDSVKSPQSKRNASHQKYQRRMKQKNLNDSDCEVKIILKRKKSLSNSTSKRSCQDVKQRSILKKKGERQLSGSAKENTRKQNLSQNSRSSSASQFKKRKLDQRLNRSQHGRNHSTRLSTPASSRKHSKSSIYKKLSSGLENEQQIRNQSNKSRQSRGNREYSDSLIQRKSSQSRNRRLKRTASGTSWTGSKQDMSFLKEVVNLSKHSQNRKQDLLFYEKEFKASQAELLQARTQLFESNYKIEALKRKLKRAKEERDHYKQIAEDNASYSQAAKLEAKIATSEQPKQIHDLSQEIKVSSESLAIFLDQKRQQDKRRIESLMSEVAQLRDKMDSHLKNGLALRGQIPPVASVCVQADLALQDSPAVLQELQRDLTRISQQKDLVLENYNQVIEKIQHRDIKNFTKQMTFISKLQRELSHMDLRRYSQQTFREEDQARDGNAQKACIDPNLDIAGIFELHKLEIQKHLDRLRTCLQNSCIMYSRTNSMNQADDESAAPSEQFQVSVLEEIDEEEETVHDRTNGKSEGREGANRRVQDQASPTVGSAIKGYQREDLLLGNQQSAYSPQQIVNQGVSLNEGEQYSSQNLPDQSQYNEYLVAESSSERQIKTPSMGDGHSTEGVTTDRNGIQEFYIEDQAQYRPQEDSQHLCQCNNEQPHVQSAQGHTQKSMSIGQYKSQNMLSPDLRQYVMQMDQQQPGQYHSLEALQELQNKNMQQMCEQIQYLHEELNQVKQSSALVLEDNQNLQTDNQRLNDAISGQAGHIGSGQIGTEIKILPLNASATNQSSHELNQEIAAHDIIKNQCCSFQNHPRILQQDRKVYSNHFPTGSGSEYLQMQQQFGQNTFQQPGYIPNSVSASFDSRTQISSFQKEQHFAMIAKLREYEDALEQMRLTNCLLCRKVDNLENKVDTQSNVKSLPSLQNNTMKKQPSPGTVSATYQSIHSRQHSHGQLVINGQSNSASESMVARDENNRGNNSTNQKEGEYLLPVSSNLQSKAEIQKYEELIELNSTISRKLRERSAISRRLRETKSNHSRRKENTMSGSAKSNPSELDEIHQLERNLYSQLKIQYQPDSTNNQQREKRTSTGQTDAKMETTTLKNNGKHYESFMTSKHGTQHGSYTTNSCGPSSQTRICHQVGHLEEEKFNKTKVSMESEILELSVNQLKNQSERSDNLDTEQRNQSLVKQIQVMNQQQENGNAAFNDQNDDSEQDATRRQKLVTQSSMDGPNLFKECDQVKSPEFNMHLESDKLNQTSPVKRTSQKQGTSRNQSRHSSPYKTQQLSHRQSWAASQNKQPSLRQIVNLDSGDDTPSASIAGESGLGTESKFVQESVIRAGGSSQGVVSSSYNFQHQRTNRIQDSINNRSDNLSEQHLIFRKEQRDKNDQEQSSINGSGLNINRQNSHFVDSLKPSKIPEPKVQHYRQQLSFSKDLNQPQKQSEMKLVEKLNDLSLKKAVTDEEKLQVIQEEVGKISLIQEQSKKLYKNSPFKKKPSFSVFSKEHIRIDDQEPSGFLSKLDEDINRNKDSVSSSLHSLGTLVDESQKLQEKINQMKAMEEKSKFINSSKFISKNIDDNARNEHLKSKYSEHSNVGNQDETKL